MPNAGHVVVLAMALVGAAKAAGNLTEFGPFQLYLETHGALGEQSRAEDLTVFLQASELIAQYPDYPPVLLLRARPETSYQPPAPPPTEGTLASVVWRVPRGGGAVLVERWPVVVGHAVRTDDDVTTMTERVRWSILSTETMPGQPPLVTMTIAGRSFTAMGGLASAVTTILEEPKPTVIVPAADKVAALAEAIAGASSLDDEITRLEAAFRRRPFDARVGTRLVLLQFLAGRPLTEDHNNPIVARWTAILKAPRSDVPRLMMDLQDTPPTPDVAHYLWMEAVILALRERDSPEILLPVAGAWR